MRPVSDRLGMQRKRHRLGAVESPATPRQVSVDQIPAELKHPNPKGMAIKVLERNAT